MELTSLLSCVGDVHAWIADAVILGTILFFLVGVFLYIRAPIRARLTTQRIISEKDDMTMQLAQGERIGQFGSFFWNTGTHESRWSDELFTIFGLHVYKTPDIYWIVSAVSETERPAFEIQWKRIVSQAGDFEIVAQIIRPDGAHRYVRLIGTTKELPHGAYEISGVAHNITKEIEVDRAKTEFVSIASHQLKTPLTSIRWLAESLLAGQNKNPLTPDQEKYISSIWQTSGRMMEMVNDLLSVSRIELGVMVVRPEEIDIATLVDNVFQEQKRAADDKQQTVTITIEEHLPHLMADKSLLRMILQNLISNAVKYTPQHGTITVDVFKDVSMHTDVLVIRVADSGIGIPEKDQTNVFTRMYRASNAQATVADGTGLGLYVIKSIVERVKGKISFQSVEHKGTIFFVTVPFVWTTEHSNIS